MDDQPTQPKPKRTRAPRTRKPAPPVAEAAVTGVDAEDAASLVAADSVRATEPAEARPHLTSPSKAAAATELAAIEDDEDSTEPGAPATRKAGKADIRALGTALASDAALRHAIFGAADPTEASDAWLRAARGVRLRKRQRAALTKVWSQAGALLVAAASGDLSHWLHRH